MLYNSKNYLEQTFKSIELPKAELANKEFDNCTFKNCNFSETQFKQCKFVDCEFIDCNLSLIKVEECSFINTIFTDSKMIGINWTAAAWPRIKLNCPLQFIKCVISHSTFLGLNLREAVIVECIAHEVDFREADLTLADLTHTDFLKSQFVNTNLTKANFAYAINYTINVLLNQVKGAKFLLPEAIGLLQGLDIELIES